MTPATKDPLADAMARLADNANWRHYVLTVVGKRDAAVRNLLYSTDKDLNTLRGEARAFDKLVDQFKRNGVKV
jgi:hypothetical protein